jgi:polar amino acid transport system substrate-binding protein
MTVTEERQQSVDFSDSYATGVQVIIVTEDSPITCADDLFGDGNYTIGVQNATTGDLYCTWDIEDEGLGTVQRYNKGADAVQALITGKVDCVVIDNEPAKAFVAANEGLTILDTEYVTEDYAIALAKGSSLTEPVNAALQELIADGTVQSILDKYIGD